MERERFRAQSCVALQLLQVSGLKTCGGLSEDSLKKVVRVCASLIKNASHSEMGVQAEMISSLLKFRQKVNLF